VLDRCANGQQLKCPTVADELTEEGLAIDVAGRIRSPRVIEVLARLVSERGAPALMRSGNGPAPVSRGMLRWIVGQGIGTALIEPRKPWQNGVAQSFNGKFRDECPRPKVASAPEDGQTTETGSVSDSWRDCCKRVSQGT
jgi:putative transposase